MRLRKCRHLVHFNMKLLLKLLNEGSMGFKKSYRKTRALRKIGNKAYDANDYPTGHIHYELANKNLNKKQIHDFKGPRHISPRDRLIAAVYGIKIVKSKMHKKVNLGEGVWSGASRAYHKLVRKNADSQFRA